MQYGWQVQASITVVRLDAKTNQPGTIVTVAKPCAGLVVGFGSLWIPSCGDHTVVRVDAETGIDDFVTSLDENAAHIESRVCPTSNR